MPKESNTKCADDLLASTAEGMYPQNYTEEIYVLNILVSISGQHQPIIFALRTRFLGCFRIRPVTQSASLLGQVSKVKPSIY